MGLFFGCLFALIDSLIFLFGEEELDSQIHKYTQLDVVERTLIIGGGSAAIAIIISGFMEEYILKNFEFQKNMFLDFMGIIIGTSIVTSIYHFTRRDK